MERVLIIEDDKKTAKFLAEALESGGYKAFQFADAGDALEWLKTQQVELVISDIGLPGLNGIQFCRLLKENPATAALPVLMLTAFKDEAHTVEGLKTGADDYVTKPFSVKELLARVEAVLRRSRHDGRLERRLASGEVAVDLDRGEASVGGKLVPLLPKEFALLARFLRSPRRILTFNFLADEVWGLDAVATRETIKVTVHRLRSKLGKSGDRIEAVQGQGYKWAEPVSRRAG